MADKGNEVLVKTIEKYIKQKSNDLGGLTYNGVKRKVEDMTPEEFEKLVIDFTNGVVDLVKDTAGYEIDISPEEMLQIIKEARDLEEPKNYKNIVPKQVYIGNSKVSNQLTKDVLGQGLIHINTAPKSKDQVLTVLKMDYGSPKMTIQSGFEFTPYDQLVHDRVCTLYEAGNEVFTPEMVYNLMAGRGSSQHIDPGTIQEVIESINKSRSIKVYIDYTAEYNRRNPKKPKDKFELSDMMLSALEVTVKMGGVERKAFKFNSKPIVYRYNQTNRQILCVPLEVFAISEVVNTKDTMLLKEYLIKRIEPMKYSKNGIISKQMAYDTLYTEMGILDADRTTKKRLRDKTKKLLEEFQANNYIKGFEEYPIDKKIKKGIQLIV